MTGEKLGFKELGAAAQAWHAALVAKAGDPREGGRGMVAEIRRASGLGEVMLTQAYGRLVARVMRYAELDELPSRTLAVLARTALVLAPVQACRSGAPSVGRAMGQQVQGRPIVSPVRAKVLFRSPDADEAAVRLRPILALLDARVEGHGLALDPGDVVSAMAGWREGRVRWAMQYHAAGAPPVGAPEAPREEGRTE